MRAALVALQGADQVQIDSVKAFAEIRATCLAPLARDSRRNSDGPVRAQRAHGRLAAPC